VLPKALTILMPSQNVTGSMQTQQTSTFSVNKR
jgi:hypothetical protein